MWWYRIIETILVIREHQTFNIWVMSYSRMPGFENLSGNATVSGARGGLVLNYGLKFKFLR